MSIAPQSSGKPAANAQSGPAATLESLAQSQQAMAQTLSALEWQVRQTAAFLQGNIGLMQVSLGQATGHARAMMEMAEDDYWRRNVLENPRYNSPLSLTRHAWQVNSQSGEDGIIQEIFRRIGTTNRYFIEVGVDSTLENNTAFLLTQGWAGCWLDGDLHAMDRCREICASAIAEGKLQVVAQQLCRENFNQAAQALNPPAEPDLISLDIDRNTYWIWEPLEAIRPRVVVIEYNAQMGPSMEWVVRYDPAASFDGSINFGASLKSLELLGRAKGYSLVGCDFRGINAFFVRNDLVAGKFLEPFTAEAQFEPIRWYTLRAPGHTRAYCAPHQPARPATP